VATIPIHPATGHDHQPCFGKTTARRSLYLLRGPVVQPSFSRAATYYRIDASPAHSVPHRQPASDYRPHNLRSAQRLYLGVEMLRRFWPQRSFSALSIPV
jgi:hypothetical protein